MRLLPYHLTNSVHLQKLPRFCVDIRAPRSLIGGRQLNGVLKLPRKSNIPRIRSLNSFRFGHVAVKFFGTIEIVLGTPSALRLIPVLLDVLPVGVPDLLGLDVLDAEKLYADNITNRIVHCEVLSMVVENFKYKDR